MARLDDEVTVFRLATMTEDLDRSELAAMVRTAERLEREWNKLTSMNVDRRLREHGLLDLFGEWRAENGNAPDRPPKQAEWWDRVLKQAAVLPPSYGGGLRLVNGGGQ